MRGLESAILAIPSLHHTNRRSLLDWTASMSQLGDDGGKLGFGLVIQGCGRGKRRFSRAARR
jgi:hypothetical protein